DVQIEPPVAVVIEKCRSGMKCARLRACDPGLVGDVSECAIAVVVIQDIASILGHEKIVKSVVVVIAPDTAHAITRSRNAGSFRDIGEYAIPVVRSEEHTSELQSLAY